MNSMHDIPRRRPAERQPPAEGDGKPAPDLPNRRDQNNPSSPRRLRGSTFGLWEEPL
jgi:hypothetical protein